MKYEIRIDSIEEYEDGGYKREKTETIYSQRLDVIYESHLVKIINAVNEPKEQK